MQRFKGGTFKDLLHEWSFDPLLSYQLDYFICSLLRGATIIIMASVI